MRIIEKMFKTRSEKIGVARAMQRKFDSIMGGYRKSIEVTLGYLDESDAATYKQLMAEGEEYVRLMHTVAQMVEENHQMLMALCKETL